MERLLYLKNRLHRLQRTEELPRTATVIDVDAIPEDQEIVAFDSSWIDTLSRHNAIYNDSVTRQWQDDPNPREDVWSPQGSRIDPSI